MSERVLTPFPSVQPSERRTLIGGSDARIIVGAEEPAPLRLGREKGGEEALEDLTGKPHPSQSWDRANANPSFSLVRAAHAEFLAALAGHPPRTIPLDADAIDLEERAEHLDKVLSALTAYVAVILDDTAQNVPGTLDLPDIEAVLADLASDVTGAIQRAAEGMAGRSA
jgi:hypothetical protein